MNEMKNRKAAIADNILVVLGIVPFPFFSFFIQGQVSYFHILISTKHTCP